MCISCSSHQANEVYTSVYTKIVIFTKEGYRSIIIPNLGNNASLIWVIMRPICTTMRP